MNKKNIIEVYSNNNSTYNKYGYVEVFTNNSNNSNNFKNKKQYSKKVDFKKLLNNQLNFNFFIIYSILLLIIIFQLII